MQQPHAPLAPARILLALLCFGFSPSSYASGDEEWFIAFKTSLGQATMSDISHGGSIGSGTQIGNFLDGRIRDQEVYDYTSGLGGTIGKRVGNWTFEGEYIYRPRTDWDTAVTTPSINTITNVFSNIESHTLLINIVRRGVINQNWSWEVGAGIGLIAHVIDADYVERATPSVPEMSFSDENSELEFTYNLFAGAVRELRGPWSLNLRYRFIDFGELNAGPFPQRAARVRADAHALEFQIAFERDL